MKKLFMVIAGLMAFALMTMMMVGWWYLDADDVKPPDLPGIIHSGELQHDGITRTWSAYIPASASAMPPVVLLLHASGGNGEQVLRSSFYSFNLEAERRGFIAVYPDGFENHWNDCRGGANYTANTRNIDDVGFLRRLIDYLVRERSADPSRVYIAGHSNGGQMAFRMAFESPELVAGIAAISASLPVAANLDCERLGRPVAALIINGTEDPVNPYRGGLVQFLGDASRGEVVSSVDTADYWAQLAGYAGQGQHTTWPERSPDDDTRVASLAWSAPDTPPVILISVIGGGHTLPHPVFNLPRILGRTSHEFDTAEIIFRFFNDQSIIPGDD